MARVTALVVVFFVYGLINAYGQFAPAAKPGKGVGQSIAIQIASEVAPGAAAIIRSECIQTNGIVAVQDFAPTIHVYTINSNGSQTDDLSAVTMTALGNNAFGATWTPSTTGIFIVEVRASVGGVAIEGSTQVTVRTRDTFDPTGLFK